MFKKTIGVCTGSAIFLLLTVTAHAQFMQTIQTPFGSRQIPGYTPPMFQNNMFYAGSGGVIEKHNITIVYTDSSKATVEAWLDIDSTKKGDSVICLLTEDKSYSKKDPRRLKRIYPKQTAYLRMDDYAIPTTGKASDSCWLFNAIDGKIKS